MKEYALELARQKGTYGEKFNILREYVQACILRIMYDLGIFRQTAFVGGTALRFLYQLPRFSEDLDFSTVSAGKRKKWSDVTEKMCDELKQMGYQVSIKANDQNVVQSASVKFESLLHEAGLSPLKSQKLFVKVEIDSNPPAGFECETKIVNKYFPIAFLTHDLPTLFAGKVHALLNRKYTKGRDFFDLFWYLSTWKELRPNILFLNNALKQTGWSGDFPSEDNWKNFLARVVKRSDWEKVRDDVSPFLEHSRDSSVFSKDNVLLMLEEKAP